MSASALAIGRQGLEGRLRRVDALYMGFVFLISADAFHFLGLHTALWVLAYGYAALRIALSFEPFVLALLRNGVFLLYPAMCLLSVLWSDVPAATLRYAVQLWMTVWIAVFLGMRFTPREIFAALAAVLFLTTFLSLANISGAIAPAEDHRGNFEGIYLSKNVLGHRTVLFAICATFALGILPGLRVGLRALAGLALLLAAGLIVVSGSATASLMSAAAVTGALLLWAAVTVRGALALAGAAVVVVGAGLLVLVLAFEVNPVAELLQLAGRDATMTGRTILWEFGWDRYLERPILGFGANGFWGNPGEQSAILRLQARYGEGVTGFHNLVLEILVTLGPLGLAAHAAGLGATLLRAWRGVRQRDPYAAWAFVTVVAMILMALVGAQLFRQHALPLILTVTLGAAMARQEP